MNSNSVIPDSHVNQSVIYGILWKSAENLFHANLPSTRENRILYKFMNFAAVQDVPS